MAQEGCLSERENKEKRETGHELRGKRGEGEKGRRGGGKEGRRRGRKEKRVHLAFMLCMASVHLIFRHGEENMVVMRVEER